MQAFLDMIGADGTDGLRKTRREKIPLPYFVSTAPKGTLAKMDTKDLQLICGGYPRRDSVSRPRESRKGGLRVQRRVSGVGERCEDANISFSSVSLISPSAQQVGRTWESVLALIEHRRAEKMAGTMSNEQSPLNSNEDAYLANLFVRVIMIKSIVKIVEQGRLTSLHGWQVFDADEKERLRAVQIMHQLALQLDQLPLSEWNPSSASPPVQTRSEAKRLRLYRHPRALPPFNLDRNDRYFSHKLCVLGPQSRRLTWHAAALAGMLTITVCPVLFLLCGALESHRTSTFSVQAAQSWVGPKAWPHLHAAVRPRSRSDVVESQFPGEPCMLQDNDGGARGPPP